MITLNYRYRIYPDATQQDILSEWMEICRSAYNYALREIKDWCNSRKCLIDRCSIEREYILPAGLKFPGEVNQLNALPDAKKEFPRLGEVPSQVLQQAVKQLHKACAGFQERGFGFPRFKKFGQFKSLLFPQFKENPVTLTGSPSGFAVAYGGASPEGGSPSVGNWRWKPSCSTVSPVAYGGSPSFSTGLTGLHVKLPKIGAIPINLHRPIPDGFVVKQVRLIKKADRWYASINIQCDVSVPDVMPHGHPVGVDIGLEKFLATSDNVKVKPPKFFVTMQGKLKLLQRRLSRKQKRSKNYEKQRSYVARMHHTIDNARSDFHFKQAHALCDGAGMVFMEDLDYTVAAKGMFGKHMLGAAFGQFRSITQYVCWKRGVFFAQVNARGTSQECPECGAQVRKDLSVRVHHCPSCGYTTDRDMASAQVIRNRGISLISTNGQLGMETAYAVDLPGAGVTPSRQEAKPRKGKTRNASK